MSKYMNEHGISRINPVEKKYQKIWASTKTNLDLKSKESKINRIIASAKKNISLISAKLELQKAYKMLQEHPSHFSLEKHNIVVKMISDIDNKISNVSENSGIFLDFTLEMLNDFRFIEVRKKLEEYKEKLDLEGFSHEVNEIKKQLELCNINEMTFKEVQKIERLLEENDRLGAKTAYLSLRDDIRSMDDAELLLFSLKERYFALEKQLKRNYSSINENYFKPFDPLEDINENLNNQGKLETKINKDEKIINISQENRNIHLKKEKDVLDALDEILNDNF